MVCGEAVHRLMFPSRPRWMEGGPRRASADAERHLGNENITVLLSAFPWILPMCYIRVSCCPRLGSVLEKRDPAHSPGGLRRWLWACGCCGHGGTCVRGSWAKLDTGVAKGNSCSVIKAWVHRKSPQPLSSVLISLVIQLCPTRVDFFKLHCLSELPPWVPQA